MPGDVHHIASPPPSLAVSGSHTPGSSPGDDTDSCLLSLRRSPATYPPERPTGPALHAREEGSGKREEKQRLHKPFLQPPMSTRLQTRSSAPVRAALSV